jgi:hypothetical protein
MTYSKFLEEVINVGIASAKEDYKNDKPDHLEGSIAGFEACRGKNPNELIEVWKEAAEYMSKAFNARADNYWYFRCYQLEVEWVMNCVSCLLINNGDQPLLSHLPTCNAMTLVSKIVGVHKL